MKIDSPASGNYFLPFCPTPVTIASGSNFFFN